MKYNLDFLIKKKRVQRVVSLITAVSMTLPFFPTPDALSPLVKMIQNGYTYLTARAEEDYVADNGFDYSGNKEGFNSFFEDYKQDLTPSKREEYANKIIAFPSFNSSAEFESFSIDIADKYPELVERGILSFAYNNGNSGEANTDMSNFKSLGTEAHPFRGKLTFTTTPDFKLPDALFDYLDVTADISEVIINRTYNNRESVAPAPLLANHVVNKTETTSASKNWTVFVSATIDESGYASQYTYAGLIGTLEAGEANLTVKNTTTEGSKIKNTNDVGSICNYMKNGTSLYVEFDNNATDPNVPTMGSNTNLSVESSNDYAGSIVGSMESGCTLTVHGNSGVTSVKAHNAAGGIVGKAEKSDVILDDFVTLGMTLSESDHAGGIYGYYIFSGTESKTIDVSQYADFLGNVTVSATTSCGGVFGMLENKGSLTLTSKSESTSAPTSIPSSITGGNNDGGLIGTYKADDRSRTLYINNLETSPTVTGIDSASRNNGGVIGEIDTSSAAAYVKFNNVKVDATGANIGAFGGLVSLADNTADTAVSHGCFINVAGDVKVSTDTAYAKSDAYGGGLIAKINKGVVRLHGTTDLTGAQPSAANNHGQLIGSRNQALVYADGSGNTGTDWVFKRYTANNVEVDDIGSWGEVVRNGENLTISEVITGDVENDHYVTIAPAVTEMKNTADFVATALNIQLNSGKTVDVLEFDDSNATKTTSISFNLLRSTNLKITGNIDLTGTGITGFMRDDGNGYKNNSSGTVEGAYFIGSIDGGHNTITLAVGEAYGDGITDPDCHGRIYRHQYNGLFARTTANALIKDLTLNGNMNVSGRKGNTYVGSVSGHHNDKTLSLSNVTVNVRIDTNDASNITTYTGGFVGYINHSTKNFDDVGVSISNCSYNAEMSVNQEREESYAGVIAGRLGNYVKLDISTLNVSGKTTSSGTYANIGGIVGSSEGVDGDKNDSIKLKNVVFDGMELEFKSTGTNGFGGFVGHTLTYTDIEFGNATDPGITLKSTVNTKKTKLTLNGDRADKKLAGLASRASGHWKVNANGICINSLTVGKSISTSVENTSVENVDIGSFGLLVNRGAVSNKGYLYLELNDTNSYVIGNDVNLNIGTYNVFDELVAYNYDSTSKDICENGQPVVSIHTTGDTVLMNGTSCNTYQNKTHHKNSDNENESWAPNPNIRYYYNLDQYTQVSGDVTTAPELLMWSVYKYAGSNIKKYFRNAPSSTINGNFNLNGYSYYPIDVNEESIDIQGTFNFYNKEIEDAENLTSSPYDDFVRTTKYEYITTNSNETNKSTQHYLMHCGLFRNVNANTDNATVNVNGATIFSGTIGTVEKDGKGSGVLVCGTVGGNTNDGRASTAKVTDTDGSISLDGIKVNGNVTASDYAPLLINKVNSYSALEFKNISTTGEYTKTDETTNEEVTAKAATSLIGNVGSGDAEGITVKFQKGIVLDGRTGNETLSNSTALALYTAYHTKNSIFSRAIFLNSFAFKDTSSYGVYNFSHSDDWSTPLHQVTYGKEISKSKQYDGEQEKYSGSEVYTSPEDSNVTDENGKYDFSNFLPYVKSEYSKNGTNQEIKVNHMSSNVGSGCGTYNDPYVITSGSQLQTIANIINSGSASDGFQINYPADAANNSWCDNKNSHKDKENTDDIYKLEDGGFTKDNGASVVTMDDMQKWLTRAYYYIENDIEIPEKYLGLGGSSDDTAFTGYIIGNSEDGKKPTIINKSSKPLVLNSYGCVVKNIKIQLGKEYLDTTSAVTSQKFSITGGCEAYGAVIGQILGGDNIIDEVEVDYNSKTLSSNNYLVPIGGYVGVILDGGLYFRNMHNGTGYYSGCTTTNGNFGSINVGTGNDYFDDPNNNPDNITTCQRLYNNPYIGRVINGFAVYEDDNKAFGESVTLDNGNKNYKITNIGAAQTKLTAVEQLEGTNKFSVSLPNAQSVFVLSAVSQSGAGTESNYALDQHRTHMAQYTGVGSNSVSPISDFSNAAINDNYGTNGNENVKIPYIIEKYVDENSKNTLTSISTGNKKIYIQLSNGAYDLSKTGFRGLNTLYRQNRTSSDGYEDANRFSITVNGLYGYVPDPNDDDDTGKTIIKLGMCVRGYGEFGANETALVVDNYPLGENQSEKLKGIGFINYVNADGTADPGSETEVYKNVTLTGCVEIHEYYATNKEKDENCNTAPGRHFYGYVADASGALIGNACVAAGKWINVENIELDDMCVVGNKLVGGVIGKFAVTGGKDDKLYMKNCSSIGDNGLTLYGGENLGGLVAEHQRHTFKAEGSASVTEFKINKFVSKRDKKDSTTDFKTSGKTRLGGLCGMVSASVEINDYKVTGEKDIAKLSYDDKNSSNLYCGGVIGRWSPDSNNTNHKHKIECENVTIENLTVEGFQSAGFIGESHFSANVTNGGFVKITDCEVKECTFKSNIYNKAPNYSNTETYSCAAGIVACSPATKDKNRYYFDSINVINCNFIGSTNTCNQNNTKKTALAGIIGYTATPENQFKNINVNGCTFKIENNSTESKDRHFGGLIGAMSSASYKCLGYNVAVSECTFSLGDGVNGTKKIGAFVGGQNGIVQLVAVNEKGNTFTNTGKNQVIPTNNASYLIYADYDLTGIADNKNTVASTVNNINNIEDGSYEHSIARVNINPKISIDKNSNNNITGDGTNPTVVLNSENTRYSYVTSEIARFTTGGDYSGKLSDYTSAMADDYEYAFPVLIVDTTDRDEITRMVNSYIAALTNCYSLTNCATLESLNFYKYSSEDKFTNYACSDSNNVFKVDVSLYKYDESSSAFSKASDQPTLKRIDNYFRMFSNEYDSGKNQFNMLDIQFIDPTDTSHQKIAYHLYIPVVVSKMLKYNFYVANLSGTNYNSEKYTNANSAILDSLGANITSLVKFEYLRTNDEWQKAINDGDPLLVSLKKSVKLKPNSSPLPYDDEFATEFVVIDKDNGGQAYYADSNTAYQDDAKQILAFENFKNGNTPFEFKTLNDILINQGAVIEAEAYTSESPNGYVETTESDATLKATYDTTGKYKFYRLAQNEETPTVAIKISGLTKNITESFYITYFTKKNVNDMGLYTIGVTAPLTMSVQESGKSLATHVDTNSELYFTLGNFFDQSISLWTQSDLNVDYNASDTGSNKIDEDRYTICTTIHAELKLIDDDYIKGAYNNFQINDTIQVFNSVYLYARRRENDIVTSGIKGYTSKTVSYSISSFGGNPNDPDNLDEYYDHLESDDEDFIALKFYDSTNNSDLNIKKQLAKGGVTIEADIELEYASDLSRSMQFPSKPSDTSNDGVYFEAYSNIAYVNDASILKSSSLSKKATDNNLHLYYTEKNDLAHVYYNVYNIDTDDPVKAFGQLGINACDLKNVNPVPIVVLANYDVFDVPDQEEGKYVKVIINLSKKDNDGKYNNVDITDYLSQIKLNGADPQQYITDEGAKAAQYIIERTEINEIDGLMDFTTNFLVKTSDTFSKTLTDDDVFYTNYQIKFKAELLKANDVNSSIAPSKAFDYVKYTNAKILTDIAPKS